MPTILFQSYRKENCITTTISDGGQQIRWGGQETAFDPSQGAVLKNPPIMSYWMKGYFCLG